MFSSPFILPVLSLTKEACRRVRIGKARNVFTLNTPDSRGVGKTSERPFLLRQAQYERKQALSKNTFPVRSPCSVLSLSKEACRRVRIEKRFEERIGIGKTIHDLERPFILRQAQYERK
jgi:hypothetical protein